jgi:hypothetical protein
MYLAGNYDFFITTRREEIDFESLGLEEHERGCFYDPIFSIPQGWRNPMEKYIRNFVNSISIKKKLERRNHGVLGWGDTDT